MDIQKWKQKHRSELREISLAFKVFRSSPLAVLGATIIIAFLFIAAFAPYLSPYDPLTINPTRSFEPPSKTNILGTDDMGRDILSRIIYGARIDLMVGIVIVGISALIGSLIGLISGYLGGLLDEVLMRIVDIFLAFPGIILAMAISGALGPSLMNAMIALSVVWWPWYARLSRGQALAVRKEMYVEAAKVCGVTNFRIIFHHILPNCLPPILVMATMDLGNAILSAAALGFLGLGAQPPTPEWGAMISIGQKYMMDYWWIATFPGLAIFINNKVYTN